MSDERQILAPVRFKQPGWPSFWGPEALKEQEALIRSRAFERGFRQKPQSDEDLIFPHLVEDIVFEKGIIVKYGKNWRHLSDPEHKDYDEPDNNGVHHDPFYVSPEWPRYIGCDVSGKGRRGTVIFTLAISPQAVRHVLDIRIGSWGAGPEFHRQLQAVNSNILLCPRRIFVENNAIQEAVVDNLKEIGGEFGNKVFPFRTGNQKMDPEIGLPGIDMQYKLGRWRIGVPHKKNSPAFPDKKNPTLCLCGICTLIRDASTFTADDLKETPDSIAAQFIAKEASRQGERYSETSANVVQISQKDLQAQIHQMIHPEKSRSLRLPVVTNSIRGKNSDKSWPFDAQFKGPHPDPKIRHDVGTCAACDGA